MTQGKLTVVARIKAKVGMEERVKQELLSLLAPTRGEPGCINYDMHQAVDNPALFLFYENWTTEQDLERHLATPHIQGWIKKSEQLLAEPIEITRLKQLG